MKQGIRDNRVLSQCTTNHDTDDRRFKKRRKREKTDEKQEKKKVFFGENSKDVPFLVLSFFKALVIGNYLVYSNFF